MKGTGVLLLAGIPSGTEAVPSAASVFPTSTTTNLQVQCRAGFQVKAANWVDMSPCRLYCECTAMDGSCKYCCSYNAGQCSRHKPLYSHGDGSACVKCTNAVQWLHEAGISGATSTSGVNSNVQ